MKLTPTMYLYPSPLPFSPLTEAELDRRQTHEEGRAVVYAANTCGDRPRNDEAAAQATLHANLSMAYCEASLIRFGRAKAPEIKMVTL
ncbi:MAG TPA: hypothetical protein VIP28_06610 [Nocardioides sp.]